MATAPLPDLRRSIQRERLFYLEFLALFTGQVSRKDLVRRFGISEPAATKDIALYAEIAPNVLHYDLRRKCYVLLSDKVVFHHDVDQSLHSLSGERAIAIDAEHAKRLPGWVSTSIKRKMMVALVACITRAIYQHRKLCAEYLSLSSGVKTRIVSPLALVHDGLRWHIRCFDHDRQQFRDYNLARFIEAKKDGLSAIRLDDDVEWNNEVSLKLVAHPKAEHPETIRMDYGMSNDAKYVVLRACLVGYFLRQWHIDCSDSASGNPRAQQLFLDNKTELIQNGVPNWAFG